MIFTLKLLFLLIMFILASGSLIPGCPSLYDPDPTIFEGINQNNPDALATLPMCYCDVLNDKTRQLQNEAQASLNAQSDANEEAPRSRNVSEMISNDETVMVQCLYGASLENITDALQAASTYGAISVVDVNGLDSGEEGMRADMLIDYNWHDEVALYVRSCLYGFKFLNNGTLNGLYDKLVLLHIEGCLMDEIHPEVNKLEKLRWFKLRSGMVDIMSDRLSNLRELQEVDLSQNGLLYIEPGTFAHMSKLTHLHLEKNVLNDSIWEVINEIPSLQGVDMRFLAKIYTMPDGALSNLVNLEELWLLRCQIGALFSNSLKGLGNLRILDLRLNVLENITAGAFEHTPKLKDLKLLANYLSPDGETFRGLGELESLDIGTNEFSTIGADWFQHTPNLRQLSIFSDRQYPPTLEFIEADAFDGLTKLEILDLTDGTIETLPDGLFKNLKNLTKLDLTGNPVRNLNENTFQGLDSLTSLGMRDMQLETLDPAVFSPIDDTLTVVDLSNQNYTCGDNLAPLVRWIQRKYDDARENNSTFELHKSIDSVCARPRALNGVSIASLDADTLVPYDPTAPSETTTTAPTTTTSPLPTFSIDEQGNIITEAPAAPASTTTKVPETTLSEWNADWTIRTTRAPQIVDDPNNPALSVNTTKSENKNFGVIIVVIVLVVAALVTVTLVIVCLVWRKRRAAIIAVKEPTVDKDAGGTTWTTIELEPTPATKEANVASQTNTISNGHSNGFVSHENGDIDKSEPTSPKTNGVISKTAHDEITVDRD